jgi:hypothetical protein
MSPAVIRSRRRGTADVRSLLNRVSMLAVIALCLSVIIISSAHLGRHFGLVGDDFLRTITIPGLAGETPKPSAAALGEAGLLDPTDNPVVVVAPIVSPSPDLSPTLLPSPILSPSPTIISRPALHSGLWVPILMYHYIRRSPDRAGIGLSVLPAAFEAQMHYLKDHGYNHRNHARSRQGASLGEQPATEAGGAHLRRRLCQLLHRGGASATEAWNDGHQLRPHDAGRSQ